MRFSIKIAAVIVFAVAGIVMFSLRAPLTTAQPNPAATPAPNSSPSHRVKMECAGCHGPGTKLPVMAPGEFFHRDAHRLYTTSVHAKIQQNGKPAAECKDCHTVGGDMVTDLPPDNPNSTVYATNQEQTCGKCHDKALTTFHNSLHGRLLEKGDTRAASCSDCHDNHAIKSVADPASQLSRTNIQNICIKCHSGVVPDYEKSAHHQAFVKGNLNAPVCTDCHNAISHDTAPATTRDFNLEMINRCSNCHASQAPSYHDTFHGQATAFGYKPAATCADCHTPHKNLPKSDPASSVHPNHLVQTCAACHKNANENFARYNPHPEPKNPDKGFATYIVGTFMHYLLLGVFGFFGLHTLLWLQRSVVGMMRGELHRPKDVEGDQWVERFATRHRFTHVLIIVSFLGLAATGLPLMYSFTDWGQWVVGVHGGLAVTRYLHRVCAIITVGYALYHLWFIVSKVVRERDWSVFWGPNSMMIRIQDVKDAIGMFRWFLYLGPKPKLDRFTYWEKFDYFAVFWGVPVIGFSGLMLWFPAFFTLFLPGEALNVAMIVHSEEALLATAFIFAFHFFHNHLRPENFPMDVVMFTGKMRLSQFKEEREAEYERHVEDGTLDSIIVDAPTPQFLRIARIFGFAAYFVGLFLVIAIFVTLLTVRR